MSFGGVESPRPRLPRCLLVVGIMFVLAGCGDSGKEANTPRSGEPVPSSLAQQQTEMQCREARERIRRMDPGASSYKGEAKASGDSVSITAGDFFFTPTCVTGVARGAVTISVKNDTESLHNVTIPDQGIDQDIPPRQTVEVKVATTSPRLMYFCKFHEQSGMLALLVAGGR